MAQLTAGFYYTRAWRLVQLLTSSVVGGVTIWAANLLGPTGGSDPLGLDSAVQYQETGAALPINVVPPVQPLATQVPQSSDVVPLVGGPQMTDLMAPIGSTQSGQGGRG